ncbi:uncharacterized protein SCHCODRAFT_02274810 [Schizophyllum commune H4-8]|uniref:uncharacterized protein n=1 Tax=Schizophyllum commune (strain H4-8 / FGSC 9210) TaxID=578458 RepID=UPI0021610839|nr:uncharacterized protein SCHCODRAFT_02274810 [Schizophyllum commune H4-8]KAI5894364.1 hypothetical protein SCHCODRAFT_02274810 [Schizophyllum commune H4-8]
MRPACAAVGRRRTNDHDSDAVVLVRVFADIHRQAVKSERRTEVRRPCSTDTSIRGGVSRDSKAVFTVGHWHGDNDLRRRRASECPQSRQRRQPVRTHIEGSRCKRKHDGRVQPEASANSGSSVTRSRSSVTRPQGHECTFSASRPASPSRKLGEIYYHRPFQGSSGQALQVYNEGLRSQTGQHKIPSHNLWGARHRRHDIGGSSLTPIK